ncbi:MAG: YafY family transcriptional regulator [Lactococcus sp.]|nr:YafY family transcriptional regulator [Lactococcus sp.]
MKLERLIFILISLLSTRKIVAKEVAQKFHVSVRTIYRDIDTLTLSGIPIFSEQGTSGGYFLDNNYKIDASLFSVAEQQFILNISNNINNMINSPTINLLAQKLTSYQPNSLIKSHYYFDFNSWDINTAHFKKIERALMKEKLLCFTYLSNKNEVSQRIVIPYILVFKVNAWYLLGFCTIKNDYRFFKLSRIRGLTADDQNFETKHAPSLSTESLEKLINPSISKSEETIKLLFSLDAVAKVYDHFTETEIQQQATGLLVTSQKHINIEFIYLILSFGQNVKVISPPSLQHQIKAILLKNLAQYDSL